MKQNKTIALDFYCSNEELCKSKFCICGIDVCPYLRATLFGHPKIGKVTIINTKNLTEKLKRVKRAKTK